MPETTLEKRELMMRAQADTSERIVRGVGVPYGETITIWGQRERFEPGSVEADGALALFRHSEPIGVVIDQEETAEGWHPTVRLSRTARADEALELARDGALPGMSIGFEPIEWRMERDDDGNDVIVYTRARIREVSLVPFPAYPSATVIEVREDAPTKEKNPMPEPTPETRAAEDLADLRSDVDQIRRSVSVILDRSDRDETPATDTRSAGAVLQAIVAGDEDTIRQYNELAERAYEGGTTADTVVKPGWVGDLTRLFDNSSGVLADTFSTGTLPATGNSIEYAQLKSNTIVVEEQVNEGDDIKMGKVAIETKTAPVKTYAGGGELSRQSIERSTVGVLNATLNALAIAAGKRKKIVLRAAYDALVAERTAIASNGGVVLLGATLSAGVAGNWEDALIDAAIRFEAEGLTMERMLVSASVFKKMRSLTVAGERVFTVAEKNASGTLDLPGLRGQMAGLEVRLDTGATGDKAAIVNGLAIRQYDTSLVTLSDEKISNLTKQFAVYRYGAVAPELPAGVVPIKLAAS